MIIAHNFIDDIDEVVYFAENCVSYTTSKYYSEKYNIKNLRFAGVRSENIVDIFPDIKNKIEKTANIEVRSMFFHKHENLENFSPIPHKDPTDYAGVIYLKGGDGCGTIVDNTLYTYEYNKFICYKGNISHQPEGFPCDRLVITFFARKR